jgi:hypothetical protein
MTSRRDPRVDVYIGKAAPFARPILSGIREAVHTGCPDVVETLKWGVPHFEHEGVLCGMAAFTQHVRFGFWKATLLKAKAPAGTRVPGMGTGKVTSWADLPDKRALVELVRAAARLNESGENVARPARPRRPAPRTPAFLAAALGKRPRAAAAFKALRPSHKREYIEWLTGAKTQETRDRRLVTALEWIADGKPRHWKHQR